MSDKDSKEEADRKKKEKPVIWLNSKLSLHEQSVPDDAELVLKKKFHYTDGIIDRGDPVQLHLLYVEVFCSPTHPSAAMPSFKATIPTL